ncbi:hypothetical protein KIP88_44220, partial [Bradyrhizobium sp. SRL28]|uniref:hypothetical protein n=1 Tax=Bradyrhizobium sp. SRL28 TaxID=2836178 RepID=UPI001BDDCC2D
MNNMEWRWRNLPRREHIYLGKEDKSDGFIIAANQSSNHPRSRFSDASTILFSIPRLPKRDHCR